jgi:hypothetical protein
MFFFLLYFDGKKSKDFSCFILAEKKQEVLWHNLCGSSGAKSDSFAMIHEHSTANLTAN